MTRRRRRIRGSDRTPSSTKGLVQLVLVLIGLALVLIYKASVGERAAGFIETVASDPELALPESVLDRADAGDAGRPAEDAAAAP